MLFIRIEWENGFNCKTLSLLLLLLMIIIACIESEKISWWNFKLFHCGEVERWKSHMAMHNYHETYSIVSISHSLTCAHDDELVNDDEKVIEDEIAFFTALISYSTFYGSIFFLSFHFCRMTWIFCLMLIEYVFFRD